MSTKKDILSESAYDIIRRMDDKGYNLAKFGTITFKEGVSTESGRYAIFEATDSVRKNILFNSELVNSVNDFNETCTHSKMKVKWDVADQHSFLTESDVQFLVILKLEKYPFWVRWVRWVRGVGKFMRRLFGGRVVV